MFEALKAKLESARASVTEGYDTVRQHVSDNPMCTAGAVASAVICGASAVVAAKTTGAVAVVAGGVAVVYGAAAVVYTVGVALNAERSMVEAAGGVTIDGESVRVAS